VRRVRGESVVGERLEGIRVGKARKLRRWEQIWLRRWEQIWLRRGYERRCGGALREKIGYRHRTVLGRSVGVGCGWGEVVVGV
jgi:hypothetical protein